MWSGENEAESYEAPTSFFGSCCKCMSTCLGLLCCCWLCQDCLGGRREPSTPLIAPPPPGPIDSRLGDLGGPHSPFGGPQPPGPPGQFWPPTSHVYPGPPPPDPYGLSAPPEPPRVPTIQPGLL